MGIILPITLLIASYLLGSIPTALIISKSFAGIDIRDYGSKNMGATNVNRVLGFKYGLIVFSIDAIKAGLIIALFTFKLLDWEASWMIIKIHPLIYGVVAVIGHMFPIFAAFKGGKGVACCTGILLAYSPLIFIIVIAIFILVLIWKRYISLSSMTAAISAFILSFFIHSSESIDILFTSVIGILCAFIIIRHIPNIKRLINHTESKFTLKKKEIDKK